MKGISKRTKKKTTAELDAVSANVSVLQDTVKTAPESPLQSEKEMRADKPESAVIAQAAASLQVVLSVLQETAKTAPESPVQSEKEMRAAKPESAVIAQAAASLQLVLLLMDPATRQFELLQLEFDSDKARVSDIVSQIPVYVTEGPIRQQNYVGVFDETAKKMDEKVRLFDFCSGKKVLVAIPKGIAVKDCARLARPILGDAQVVKMVCCTRTAPMPFLLLLSQCMALSLSLSFSLSAAALSTWF
jgi:hypothetical protein